ncbi:mitochondrial beta-lactamase protein (sulfur dioxygenase) [Andalucia godoyi]|uniref:Mitochondrial beta-lactamase protein (Sulfur dioxygenase) n=1 Tax=Andalucia godoyi TaxID=505711 RepID=A0A8K0F4G1_ANDGO|nr:mitochondrial beta-lactamase protein (sulfur dioxygenase) [Andalucia godoyi]|eukprot:ANDGO_00564.mRNA.1 mitochondrial beta-lactamase protein (sulfur dioxygenase)
MTLLFRSSGFRRISLFAARNCSIDSASRFFIPTFPHIHRRFVQKSSFSSTSSAALLQMTTLRSFPAKSNPSASLQVSEYFHKQSNTWTFIVACSETKEAMIVDPCLEFDVPSGRIGTTSADQIIASSIGMGYRVKYLNETHAHADHITASAYIKERLLAEHGVAASYAIGERIVEVQKIFADVFDWKKESPSFVPDGSGFDKLWKDGDTFSIGNFQFRCLHTPGHTPACVTYVCDDAKVMFGGDTLFHDTFGTARADFPGGSASTLYDSIQKLLALPGDFTLFVGHDYVPGGSQREFLSCSTIGEEREKNVHVGAGKTREEYIKMRTTRDAGLSVPNLLLPSIQVNALCSGKIPQRLVIPVNKL